MQSGNVVSSGFYLVDGDWARFTPAIVSVLCFGVGSALSGVLMTAFLRSGRSFTPGMLFALFGMLYGAVAVTFVVQMAFFNLLMQAAFSKKGINGEPHIFWSGIFFLVLLGFAALLLLVLAIVSLRQPRSPDPAPGGRFVGGLAAHYAVSMSFVPSPSQGPTGQPAMQLSPDTVVVSAGRPARGPDAPVNPPIVLSSTFHGTGTPVPGERVYGRYSNPTWDPFEAALAELEGAALPALVFSSGLAAVAAALSLVPTGGTLVMPRHSYQGSLLLAAGEAANGRFTIRTVDIADTDQVLAALRGSAGSGTSSAAAGAAPADMLWIESPTNPMLEVAEIAVLAAAARDAGALVVADNTFSTPLVTRPLELGADVVLHSVTKYLAGHSDVVLGALATSDVQLRARLHGYRSLHGAVGGPFEVWLALRGLRTLALRIERSQATAGLLAQRLLGHPAVEAVRYPGLPDDAGHERAAKQMDGFGSILSIEVAGGAAAAEAVTENVRLWLPATSLGGVESLIERRRRQPGEPHTVPENLLRLSVGIENAEDLWADLSQALPR